MKTEYICDECGLELSAQEYEEQDDTLCPECGGRIEIRQKAEKKDLQAAIDPPPDPMIVAPPGRGKGSPIPADIRGWNWGAFLMTILWGLGNGVYWRSFLVIVPVVGIIMPFVLGAKGNKWAWQSKQWDSIEHFKSTQKKWALGGLLLFFATIALLVLMTFFSMHSA